jgi:hypothetical protein
MPLWAKYKFKNIPIKILTSKKIFFSEKSPFLSMLARLLLNMPARSRLTG